MSNFVSIESEENVIKLKNMLHVGVFIWFVWVLFHFTIIFFFWMVLESILLVGLFLWIWNLVALALDIPIWVLQKYLPAKHILMWGAILVIFVSLIFLKFIYFEGISEILPKWYGAIERTVSFLGEFLNSSLNIVLLLLAACLYGVIKESFDVTVLSYIFNNSSPGEYATLISKYNIFFGIWAMSGLIFSWILLALYIKLAIFIFIGITLWFLIFIFRFFDNKDKTIEFEKIKTIKLDVLKNDFLNKKEELIRKINTKNLIELSRQSKVILLKPLELKKKIDFQEIYHFSLSSFKNFHKIIFWIPRSLLILWFLAVIMQYGFWDTFVATFQVEFLQKIVSLNYDSYLVSQSKGIITGYILLGLLIIPAFLLQDFFIQKSNTYGVFRVIMFWFLISSVSLIFFGFVNNIYYVLFFWLLNSVWYAATMPLSQATFSWLYNEEYAKKNNLKEVDTTISAAPLKIVLNAANVIGLLLGSLIVKLVWFNMFFILFWLLLFLFFIFSLIKMRKRLWEFSKKKTTKNTPLDVDFV